MSASEPESFQADQSGTNPQALFDLIDRYVDKKGRIDQSRLHGFRLEVINHYKDWRPPRREGDIRICTNARTFRGISPLASSASVLSDSEIEAADNAYEGDGFSLRLMRRATLGPLLYADQLVDVDPLSFEPYFRGSEDWRVLGRMSEAIALLRRVRSLVEAGMLILAPIQDQYADNFKNDADLQGFKQYLVGQDFTPSDVESFSSWYGFQGWYIRDALRTARAANASIAPAHYAEWHYVNYLLAQHRPRDGEAGRVVAGLVAFDLPMFAGVPASTLIAIRKNEEAFEAWRAALRSAARTINVECDSDRFESEARQVYNDLLLPQAIAVRRSVSRSEAMKAAVIEQPLRFVLGAGIGLGASAAIGLPLPGVLVSGTASAIANVAYAGLKVEKPNGVAAVLSMLQGR